MPVGQKDRFMAVSGQARGYLGSLQVTPGLEFEHHTQPYMGTAG